MAHEKVLYEVQRTRYLQVYANGQGTKPRRYLNYESILYQVLIDDGQGLVYNHGQDLGTSQGRVQTEYLLRSIDPLSPPILSIYLCIAGAAKVHRVQRAPRVPHQ